MLFRKNIIKFFFFWLLILVGQCSWATYDYNFPIQFESYPKVTTIDPQLISKSEIRSTLFAAMGDTDLVSMLSNQKLTSLLLSTEMIEAVKKEKEYVLKDHYTSTNLCSETQVSTDVRKMNRTAYLVKKEFYGCNKRAQLVYTYEFYPKAKEVAKISKEQKKYLYLSDKEHQVPYRWKKKEIEFQVVGNEKFFNLVSEALKNYKLLLEPQLKIKLIQSESCEWIDPNKHCIFLYDSKVKKQDNSIHFAATNLLANPVTGEIIDADILLRKADYEKWQEQLKAMIDEQVKKSPESKAKLDQYLAMKSLQYLVNIITHEFGHALGLAHNFSEKNQSIMGYNQLVNLADYDYDALNALYDLKNKKRSSVDYELVKAPVK